MKRAGPLLLVVLLVASGIISYLLHRPSTSAAAPASPKATETAMTAAAGATAPARSAPTKLTKITADERRQIADRIAAAHAASGYHATTPRPSLPPGVPDEDSAPISKQTLRQAMRDVIGEIQGCYEAALPTLPGDKSLAIKAHITLTGDKDIGTLIDADQLFDDKNAPLPEKLDSCLRSTFQTIELPPLAEGDTIDVQYPFSFTAN